MLNFVNGPPVDPLRESVTKQEQWAFIKFHVLLGTPAAEVFKMIQTIARSQALSRNRVNTLYREFSDRSRLSSAEAPRDPRPRTSTDEMHKELLTEMILEDNNWSVFDFTDALGISKSSVERLMKELGAKKVATRWVPHQLTDAQKMHVKNLR